MKKFLIFCISLLFNAIIGASLALAAGFSPAVGIVAAEAAASVPGFFANASGAGILRAGILRELWTGEMVKALRGGLEHTWLT